MNKADIVAELEEIIAARLFGTSFRSWLVTDKQTGDALHRQLIELGVIRETDSGSYRSTLLGAELDDELLAIFMGCVEPSDTLTTLELRGLVGESEADALIERIDPDNDKSIEALHRIVKAAYVKFRGAKVPH